jgi:nucleotide-binding universal stress UspA family protein
MYKHILLPTDGSALSETAIANGVRFAKEIGAKVTGLYAVVASQVESDEGYAPVEVSPVDREKLAKTEAETYLAVVSAKAREIGVACETCTVASDSPHQAIIKAASDRSCDLIVMASNGRKGITGELVGSETAKVITHCKIPVLVYR